MVNSGSWLNLLSNLALRGFMRRQASLVHLAFALIFLIHAPQFLLGVAVFPPVAVVSFALIPSTFRLAARLAERVKDQCLLDFARYAVLKLVITFAFFGLGPLTFAYATRFMKEYEDTGESIWVTMWTHGPSIAKADFAARRSLCWWETFWVALQLGVEQVWRPVAVVLP